MLVLPGLENFLDMALSRQNEYQGITGRQYQARHTIPDYHRDQNGAHRADRVALTPSPKLAISEKQQFSKNHLRSYSAQDLSSNPRNKAVNKLSGSDSGMSGDYGVVEKVLANKYKLVNGYISSNEDMSTIKCKVVNGDMSSNEDISTNGDNNDRESAINDMYQYKLFSRYSLPFGCCCPHLAYQSLTEGLFRLAPLQIIRKYDPYIVGGIVRTIVNLTAKNGYNLLINIGRLWHQARLTDIDIILNKKYQGVVSILLKSSVRGIQIDESEDDRLRFWYRGFNIDMRFSSESDKVYFTVDALVINANRELISLAKGIPVASAKADTLNKIMRPIYIDNDKNIAGKTDIRHIHFIQRMITLYLQKFTFPSSLDQSAINNCFQRAARAVNKRPCKSIMVSRKHFAIVFNNIVYQILTIHAKEGVYMLHLSTEDLGYYIVLTILNNNILLYQQLHQFKWKGINDHSLTLTALLWSANVGSIDMIDIILTNSRNVSNAEFELILLVALYHGQLSTVQLLIEGGVRLYSNNWYYSVGLVMNNLFHGENKVIVTSMRGEPFSPGYELAICLHQDCCEYAPCSLTDYNEIMKRVLALYQQILSFINTCYSLSG